MARIELRTPRLVLRPPDDGDVDRIWALANNLNVARMVARMPHPYTVEDARAFIAIAREAAQSGEPVPLAVTLDGAFIGGAGIGLRDGGPFLGYWIGEPYWGRGYAGEAARAVVRRFFETRPGGVIRSAYAAENVASKRIQDRLGFEAVGEGMHYSLGRGADVPSVFTELTRARFFERLP